MISIKGFEDYKINKLGEIFSLKSNKILKHKHNTQGYCTICLRKNNKSHYFLISRLLALHFIEKPKDMNYVNHKDGNILNNKLSNLEWTAKRGNALHSYHVLKNYRYNLRKLSNKEVKEIKLASKTLSQRELAKKYNVSQVTIFNLIHGKTYYEVI